MVPSFRLLPTPPFLTSFGTEVPAMYLPRKACTVVSKAPNFLVHPSPWAASRIWYSFMDGLKSPSMFFRLHQNAMVLPANSPVSSVQSSFTRPLMSSSPNLMPSIRVTVACSGCWAFSCTPCINFAAFLFLLRCLFRKRLAAEMPRQYIYLFRRPPLQVVC